MLAALLLAAAAPAYACTADRADNLSLGEPLALPAGPILQSAGTLRR